MFYKNIVFIYGIINVVNGMDNFYETIFLKEDSSLEKELDDMFINGFNKTDRFNLLRAGVAGEKQVAYHLNKSNIGMYAIRDINFTIGDLTAQVDFVVVTSYHCYFIECKNYNADIIHVDETRNFEISTKYGTKYVKKGIKSPISQVEDQLNVFKKICLDNQEEVTQLLNGIKFNDYFRSLVVFTNPDNRLDIKNAPYDIKYRILKADNLIRQMEYEKDHYNGKRLSQEEMKNIADFILSKNVEPQITSVPKVIENTDKFDFSEYSYNYISNSRSLELRRKFKIIFWILILLLLCYCSARG